MERRSDPQRRSSRDDVLRTDVEPLRLSGTLRGRRVRGSSAFVRQGTQVRTQSDSAEDSNEVGMRLSEHPRPLVLAVSEHPRSELLIQARETLAYIVRHKAERGEGHFCEDFGCSSVEPLCEGILALEAELARLREALEQIRDRSGDASHSPGEVARAALNLPVASESK
jgi:hypothetical protein